ncbi:MAG: hypothetical protein Q9160_004421 [Pyrenula sp. 1 TL-2023]
MTPAFGFSAGDFIAAIELCTKVAKVLKDSGAAAAEYQQVVLELQGLQNILTRLSAFEPTESNAQHVNAIRGAALASILPLQGFLLKLKKFEHSMSPFAAKKTFTMSRAGRQTQYALVMADEIKKMRAVIYGNVIRINVLLATHASETLSKTEKQLATHHRALLERSQDTRNDMATIIAEMAEVRAGVVTFRDEARRSSLRFADQVKGLSNEVETNSATLMQGFSSLTAGIGSITSSVSGIRNLSLQILSLLRMIPAELGGLVQNVIRSNARIESTLLSMDRKMAASPSLSLETNIRLEDALGRLHADIPYEWFQYWEVKTFEGLLRARFKDAPGRQKVENGDFRLVYAKRPTISLNKDSWSATINPGAQIIMLMIITNIAFQNSSCPRRSCTGKAVSKNGNAGLVTCPACGLCFIPQVTPADSIDGNDIIRVQHMEDARLFGKRAASEDIKKSDLSRQMLDVTEDIEMMDVSGDGANDPLESKISRMNSHKNVLTGPSLNTQKPVEPPSTSSQNQEPPIMSWLSQTVPPKNPDSVREWRDAAETEQLDLKERETKELEVFRNVQIVVPAEAVAPGMNEPSVANTDENDLDLGARVHYRNIMDRYPQIQRFFARRLAVGNWQRQKRLTVKQSEAERARLRAASRTVASERQFERKLGHLNEQTEDALAEADDWEDVCENEVCATLGMDSLRGTEPKLDTEYPAFGHPTEFWPSWSTLGPPLDDAGRLLSGGLIEQPMSYISTSQQWQLQGFPATSTSMFDASNLFDFRQASTYQSHDISPNVAKTKERRFCSLPPLPLPLAETSLTAGSIAHVMDDLQPYMCPVADCSDVNATFSRRFDLLQHIRRHPEVSDSEGKNVRCPFCDLTNLSGPMGKGKRHYIKHIGHHMEEIAFGVVSTAYENWSYDESGSDLEPDNFYTPGAMEYDQYPSSSQVFGNGLFEPAHTDTHASPVTESFTKSWTDVQHEPNETHYEMNFWTGKMTATSPASSENSGLRDPYPIDYLSAGSADSESHGFSSKRSTITGNSKKRLKTVTTKYSAKSTDKASAEKRVGRRKGPLRPEQRRQAQEIRKSQKCIRCKFLLKTCDKGNPCDGCKSKSHARPWTVPCTRTTIRDLGYFLRGWGVDYERISALGFPITNVKGFSSKEDLLYITHGYGHWFPLSAREVYLRDDSALGVNWMEAKSSESGVRHNQQFEADTAKLSVGTEDVSFELMIDYLDRHINECFENFVDAHFNGTPFLTECLKTIHRYFQRDQSVILRKALRLIIAYNLTFNLTMMKDESQYRAESEYRATGYVRNPDSRLFGQTVAPVMINVKVKGCLADVWRVTHRELLEELDALYSSVYSGHKLKEWDKIFFTTLAILAVWEEMQFDCRYRILDEGYCQKFCSEMEGTPVGVLIGLLRAISQKLPPLEDWSTEKHGPILFNWNSSLHDALSEMREHVRKYGEVVGDGVKQTWLTVCNR